MIYDNPNSAQPSESIELSKSWTLPIAQEPISHQLPIFQCGPQLTFQEQNGIEHSSSTGRHPPSKRRPRLLGNDRFVIVNQETAKRGRNGPPPGIPILVSAPQVSGPSEGGCPTTAVFAETHTMESYREYTKSAAARPKRKRRAAQAPESQSRKRRKTTAQPSQTPIPGLTPSGASQNSVEPELPFEVGTRAWYTDIQGQEWFNDWGYVSPTWHLGHKDFLDLIDQRGAIILI